MTDEIECPTFTFQKQGEQKTCSPGVKDMPISRFVFAFLQKLQLLIALAVFAAPTICSADLLSLSGGFGNAIGGDCQSKSANTGSVTLECSGSATANHLGSGSVLAQGDVGSGRIGVKASVSMPSQPFLFVGNAGSQAELLYDFEVSNANVVNGLAKIEVSLDGFQELLDTCPDRTTGACNSFIQTFVTVRGGSSEDKPGPFLTDFEGANDFFVFLPVNNNRAFLDIGLMTIIACSNVGGDTSTSCNGLSDWSHTLQITGATIFDENSNVVAGADLVSQSGFNPNSQRSAVPEPSTLCLAAIGVVGFLSRNRPRILRAT